MHSKRRTVHVVAEIAAFLLATFSPALRGDQIVVTTAADVVFAGDGCSLREAIINAETGSQAGSTECAAGFGDDVITFAIGSGPRTITLEKELPLIHDTLTIDGTTQPGFSGVPLIQLDGSKLVVWQPDAYLGDGLVITARRCLIKGLVVSNFPGAGIRITQSDVTIAGNYLGTNASGTAKAGNLFGVEIELELDGRVLIGGSNAAARNVISGNGFGVFGLDAAGVEVKGNYIGTDAAGAQAVPNGSGIVIQGGSGFEIGSLRAGEGNVIAGNTRSGLAVGAPDCKVIGNRFGYNAAGTTSIPGWGKVVLTGSSRTLISRNRFVYDGSGSPAIVVRDDPEFPAVDNSILHNRFSQQPAGNAIAIDLGNDGPTANDAGDSDTGPNNLQNFPTITRAAASGATLTVDAALDSLPNTRFAIELYLSSTSGRLGETEVAYVETTTDDAGHAEVSATFPFAGNGQQFVTALATELWQLCGFSGCERSTSEFSDPVPVADCASDVGGPTVAAPGAITLTATECR